MFPIDNNFDGTDFPLRSVIYHDEGDECLSLQMCQYDQLYYV